MIEIRKPRINIHASPEHVILLNTANQASASILVGQISFSNLALPCQCQIVLTRNGRLNSTETTNSNTASRNPILDELGLAGLKQRRGPFNYQSSEKLAHSTTILDQATVGLNSNRCTFQLAVPSFLPSTAELPSLEIVYTLVVTCILPCGRILQASQDLRISRKNDHPILLQPSRKVAFPDCSFAVKVNFEAPVLGPTITIPAKLHLSGLSLPRTALMHATDTRWMVPREIKWRIEETAVIISGIPDDTGHVPIATATRIVKNRELSRGREKLKIKFPLTKPGNTPVAMLNPDSMDIPFNPTVPEDARLGDTTALTVAGGHVLHTVLSTKTSSNPASPRTRFTVFLDYTLHIWLRTGVDTFEQESGNLVNRKMDEMAYTIVCPLQPVVDTSDSRPGTPLLSVPPAYEVTREQAPPEYDALS